MLKRTFIIMLALLMAVPMLDARRKKPKVGEVADNVYTDKSYQLSVNVIEGWKYRIGRSDDPIRIVFTQSDPLAPSRYQDNPSLTQTPRLVMWVGETNQRARPFIDSLVMDDFKSDAKDEMRQEFDILNKFEIKERSKRPIQVGTHRGFMWQAESPYTEVIQSSASSVGGRQVSGKLLGTIIGVRGPENTMVVFQLISEEEFHDTLLEEAMVAMASLRFAGEEAAAEADGQES